MVNVLMFSLLRFALKVFQHYNLELLVMQSTAGADASVEALKLYNMKLLALLSSAYNVGTSSSIKLLNLHCCKKWEMIDHDLC